MGKQAFFHADQEHQRELQTLDRVQGHQLHALLPFVGLGLARFQRGMAEKGFQRRQAALLVAGLHLESLAGADQFLQVFAARLATVAAVLLEMGLQTGVLDAQANLLRQLEIATGFGQALYQLDIAGQRVARPRGQRRTLADQLQGGRPQGDAFVTRQFADAIHAFLPQPPRRMIDGTFEGAVVHRVDGHAQPGQGILDLGALEEAQAAIDAVGNAPRNQDFLELPGLCIGAVEHGDIVAAASLGHPVLDAIDDEARLVLFVVGVVVEDRLALVAGGPQLLAETAAVVVDQRVGGLEDGRGGTVVLLQADDPGAGKILLEVLDVLDARAAPAVDRLVVVADHEYRRFGPGQQPQPGVLDGIGVLELVHQDMTEAALVVPADVVVVANQFQRAQQQLGKVDDPGALAQLLVQHIDAQQLLTHRIVAGIDMLRSLAFVLAGIDEPLRLLGRVLGLVQFQLAHRALDHAQLIVAVEYLEGLRQLRLLPVSAQQAMGQTVEGAHPHGTGGDAQQLLDPPAHLARRLVGEGHGQHRKGRQAANLADPGDAMGQHPGLAAAGAGQHQHRPRIGGYRLALRVVETVEYVGYVHRKAARKRNGHCKRSRPGDTNNREVGGKPDQTNRSRY